MMTVGVRGMRPLAVAAVALLAIATAACGGSGSRKSSTASVANPAGRASNGLAVDGSVAAGDVASTTTPQAGEPLSAGRNIVRTADMRVRVGYARAAADRAEVIADQAGGYVASQESGGAGHAEARVVLKVPPDHFTAVIDQLARLGTVLERSTNATDVTEKVVDLDGRLKTAQSSADRLRGLMARAGSAPEIANVESQLAARETEIESLAGQQRVLTNQVELATVTARFTEHGRPATVSHNIPGFGTGLTAGWVALVNTGKVGVTIVGALLPFAVVAALGFGVLTAIRRIRRRRTGT